MSVSEICNREVIVLHCNGTIAEAAKLMFQYYVGTVIVVEKRNGL